jgi:hypothetical protein
MHSVNPDVPLIEYGFKIDIRFAGKRLMNMPQECVASKLLNDIFYVVSYVQ